MSKDEHKEEDQFIYKVSHDLREPLTTVLSYAQLLKQLYANHLDDNGNRFLDVIINSTNQLNKRIAGLTQLSRVGRGQVPEQADCTALLKLTLQDLDTSIKESSATIEYETLPVIVGYPIEIRRLFKELLCNALTFKKDGVPPHIKISSRKTDGKIELIISDNGVGMDIAKKLDKLFVPFYKVTQDCEGGVGLAICKKIAELHGGTISATCELGKGCTFNVVLKEKSAT